jgi:hypothetical protein
MDVRPVPKRKAYRVHNQSYRRIKHLAFPLAPWCALVQADDGKRSAPLCVWLNAALVPSHRVANGGFARSPHDASAGPRVR